jgi:hypothetical protein
MLLLKELRTLTREESLMRDAAALKIQQALLQVEKQEQGSRGGNENGAVGR